MISVIIPVCLSKSRRKQIYLFQQCVVSVNKSIQYYNMKSGIEFDDIQLLIIDDYSDFNIQECVGNIESVKIKKNVKSKGHGGALNSALEPLDSCAYIFTDSDCVVSKEWIYNFISLRNMNLSIDGICGPNWVHQTSNNRWHKFITKNETQLMKFTYQSYLSNDNTIINRIDCRNLLLTSQFVANVIKLRGYFFDENTSSTSNITSLSLRFILQRDLALCYSPELMVYHAQITSLKVQLKKYYLRGKSGKYKFYYKQKYSNLFEAFFRLYFVRHFVSPVIKSNVSIFYLWPIHFAFWYGIVLSNKIK